MSRESPHHHSSLSWTDFMLTKLVRKYSILSSSFDSDQVFVSDMTNKASRKTRIGPEQLRGKSSNDSFFNEEDLNIHDSVSIRSLTSVETESGQSVSPSPHQTENSTQTLSDFEQKRLIIDSV